MMRVDGSTVVGERGVALRSASLFVNEKTGANDYLMEQFLCHSGELFTHMNCCVYMKMQAIGATTATMPGCALHRE